MAKKQLRIEPFLIGTGNETRGKESLIHIENRFDLVTGIRVVPLDQKT
jgi:hypothetical protein